MFLRNIHVSVIISTLSNIVSSKVEIIEADSYNDFGDNTFKLYWNYIARFTTCTVHLSRKQHFHLDLFQIFLRKCIQTQHLCIMFQTSYFGNSSYSPTNIIFAKYRKSTEFEDLSPVYNKLLTGIRFRHSCTVQLPAFSSSTMGLNISYISPLEFYHRENIFWDSSSR